MVPGGEPAVRQDGHPAPGQVVDAGLDLGTAG